MSEFSTIQLPPNSTGQKVAQTDTLEITYNNGTNDFVVGDLVETDSGLAGEVIKVKGTTNNGEIYIKLTKNFDGSSLVSGEEIKSVEDASVYAEYNGTYNSVMTQNIVISGKNNPLNGVFVNDQGGLVTTFSSGDVSFDAFGKLKTSQSTIVREYQPIYDTLPEEFEEYTANGGTITWDSTSHVVDLFVPTTPNAHARRRSHIYHKYQTGIATTVLFSVYADDSGKTGVVRNVGLYDDNDGVYFHMDELLGMACVVKSSTSGVVTYNEVYQQNWNLDRLDGTRDAFNISGHQLDPTASQVMFIDFQWLGAGRVRFGFVIDGVPIACHEFNHANDVTGAYMRTGSLPLTMEIYNKASGSASNSHMYNISATVLCEGEYKPKQHLSSGSLPPAVTVPTGSDNDYVFIGAVRPVEYISYGDRISAELTDVTFNHSSPGSPPSPGTIVCTTANLVTAGFVSGDYIQIDDATVKNRGTIYIIDTVTSNTITVTSNSAPMYQDGPVNCTIKAKSLADNRAIGEIKDITLCDVSGNNHPLLVELVKNAGIEGSNSAVLSVDVASLAGTLTNYTNGEVCSVTGGSGRDALIQIETTAGSITDAYVINGGQGYANGETLTLVGNASAATIDIDSVGDADFVWVDAYPGNMLDAAKPSTGVARTTWQGSAHYTTLMQNGYVKMDLRDYFEKNTETMHRKATLSDAPDDWTIRVKTFDSTHTANIAFAISWLEVRM